MAHGQDEAIDQAIREYFHAALDLVDEFVEIYAPEPEVDVDDCLASIEARLAQLRRRLVVQDFPIDVRNDAHALIEKLPADVLSSRFHAVQRANAGILRARIEADRVLIAKLHGDYVQAQISDPLFVGLDLMPNLAAPAQVVVPHAMDELEISPPLNVLAKKYSEVLSTQGLKKKTLGDLRLTMSFAEAVIDFEKPASQLDANDMKALRDLIGQIPAHFEKKEELRGLSLLAAVQAGKHLPRLGYETQKKRFDFFKRFVAWMVAEEFLAKVPGADLKLLVKKPPKGKPKRLPYDVVQLQKIFGTPIYRGRRSIKHSGMPGDLFTKDGKYWVPLIALYAGLRSGEIIQLLKSDIRVEEGIHYFDISKSDGESDEYAKSIKTGSSYRRVPIHSAILDLGFLSYVSSCENGRLFSDLQLGGDGTYSQPWSKFWSNLGKKWLFSSPLHVFHSFRHNFIDALHEANVTDSIAMQLCGHTEDGAHWGYGKGSSMTRLKLEVEKVRYAGLQLTHLKENGWKN